MDSQVPFQRSTLELPLPGQDTGRDGKRDTDRRREKIEVGDRSKNRLFPPERQDFKHCTHNKQRDRKMNEHRVLRMRGKQRSFEIERIYSQNQCFHFSTTILPVILGWTEQKYS